MNDMQKLAFDAGIQIGLIKLGAPENILQQIWANPVYRTAAGVGAGGVTGGVLAKLLGGSVLPGAASGAAIGGLGANLLGRPKKEVKTSPSLWTQGQQKFDEIKKILAEQGQKVQQERARGIEAMGQTMAKAPGAIAAAPGKAIGAAGSGIEAMLAKLRQFGEESKKYGEREKIKKKMEQVKTQLGDIPEQSEAGGYGSAAKEILGDIYKHTTEPAGRVAGKAIYNIGEWLGGGERKQEREQMARLKKMYEAKLKGIR